MSIISRRHAGGKYNEYMLCSKARRFQIKMLEDKNKLKKRFEGDNK